MQQSRDRFPYDEDCNDRQNQRIQHCSKHFGPFQAIGVAVTGGAPPQPPRGNRQAQSGNIAYVVSCVGEQPQAPREYTANDFDDGHTQIQPHAHP